MVWAQGTIVLFVIIVQLTSGRENTSSGFQNNLQALRNSLPRSTVDERTQQNEVSEDEFPGPILYRLQDNLRPSNGFLSIPPSASDGVRGSYWMGNNQPYQKVFQNEDPFVVFGDPSSSVHSEELKSETTPNENTNSPGDNTNSNLLRDNFDDNFNNNNNNLLRDNLDTLNKEERFLLHKRLQMNGMGLLGSPKGQQSLVGFSKSRPKGLVLSIDLGIKALRDAIMHAKVQQKNREHQVQAQKNMRLLHNIGKRRASPSASLDRP